VSSTEPYEALAALLESELELIAARDFEGVAVLNDERAALVRMMSPSPPASARDALLRCDGLQKRVTVELERMRESILTDLRQVRLAQRTAAGYRPPLERTPSIVASA
jgi:hypothetical protein